MVEDYDEMQSIEIEGSKIKYVIKNWEGIFSYTVGDDGIYYVDPKYIDKFLKQGF